MMTNLLVLYIVLTLLVLSCTKDLILGFNDKEGDLKDTFRFMRTGHFKPSKQGSTIHEKHVESKGKEMGLTLVACCIATAFGTIFMKSLPMGLVTGLVGLYYPYHRRKALKAKAKAQLSLQFKDALFAISSSLKAGSSLQRAIVMAHRDMEKLHKSPSAPIVIQLTELVRQLEAGIPMADALLQFSDRCQNDDVEDFVNIAILTQKRGGNLNEVIGNITSMINDKIVIEHEIRTLVAGKKSEAKLLTFMPIVMVFLLSTMSPSYMAPMFETLMGRLLLLGGLVLLLLNYIIGKKIVHIEI